MRGGIGGMTRSRAYGVSDPAEEMIAMCLARGWEGRHADARSISDDGANNGRPVNRHRKGLRSVWP